MKEKEAIFHSTKQVDNWVMIYDDWFFFNFQLIKPCKY